MKESTNKAYWCNVNALCQNTEGSYKCVCKAGLNADWKK